jgi:hypothetical protein
METIAAAVSKAVAATEQCEVQRNRLEFYKLMVQS